MLIWKPYITFASVRRFVEQTPNNHTISNTATMRYILTILALLPVMALAQGNPANLPNKTKTMDTTSKTLKVKKIALPKTEPLKALAHAMDSAAIEYNNIDVTNWADYPYPTASVQFRIAYTDNAICLQYSVKEPYIKATSKEDAGSAPYKDSCVEFFVIPDNTHYYNLEQNCIGIGTFAGGAERTNRTKYTQEILDKIQRHSTIPAELFTQKDVWSAEEIRNITDKNLLNILPCNLLQGYLICWQLDIILPIELFTLKEVGNLQGKTVMANFYKCGDDMPVRHYLSWNPIGLERPNFHSPHFFGKLIFE